MKYNVFLIYDAEEDIFEIYNCVAANVLPGNADALFNNIHKSTKILN